MDRPPLTEGSIPRAIVRLAAPMLIAGLLQSFQNLIDLFWVGSLGPRAVAAVTIAGTVLMLLAPLFMGAATGTLALVARAIGAGRNDDACRAAGQSLVLALVLGGLAGTVGFLLARTVIGLLGPAPAVLPMAVSYLRIALLGSFTVFLLFMGNSALQGAGDTVRPMLIMGAANVLNMALDPLLIFGIGPLPRLGVGGAALATVIAQASAAAISMFILFSGRTRLHIRNHQIRPDFALAFRILRIGVPAAGQMLARSLMNAVMMRIVASCGTVAVAAFGVGFRFHMLVLMPAFALGGAAATLVGQNLGAHEPDRAARSAWLATAMDAAWMALAAILMVTFAPVLIDLFTDDPDVIRVGASYLRTVSPFYVFTALGIVLGRALSGAGDTLPPMLITILSLWGFQVPLAVLFSRIIQPPTQGIWWAIAVATVLNGSLVALWFLRGRWKHKHI
jgi:putative MATE family efflux protein